MADDEWVSAPDMGDAFYQAQFERYAAIQRAADKKLAASRKPEDRIADVGDLKRLREEVLAFAALRGVGSPARTRGDNSLLPWKWVTKPAKPPAKKDSDDLVSSLGATPGQALDFDLALFFFYQQLNAATEAALARDGHTQQQLDAWQPFPMASDLQGRKLAGAMEMMRRSLARGPRQTAWQPRPQFRDFTASLSTSPDVEARFNRSLLATQKAVASRPISAGVHSAATYGASVSSSPSGLSVAMNSIRRDAVHPRSVAASTAGLGASEPALARLDGAIVQFRRVVAEHEVPKLQPSPLMDNASEEQREELFAALEPLRAQQEELIEAGKKGGAGTLPHLDALKPFFPGHDLESIRAHTGKEAKEANEALGSLGYATGDDVVLATTDLFTVAHEVAHVIQQREGRAPAGQGEVGDRFEQEADRVAESVVRGERPDVAADDAVSADQLSPYTIERRDEYYQRAYGLMLESASEPQRQQVEAELKAKNWRTERNYFSRYSGLRARTRCASVESTPEERSEQGQARLQSEALPLGRQLGLAPHQIELKLGSSSELDSVTEGAVGVALEKQVVVAPEVLSMDADRRLGLLAHELTHIAQRHLTPSPGGRPEHEARQNAATAAKGGLLHRPIQGLARHAVAADKDSDETNLTRPPQVRVSFGTKRITVRFLGPPRKGENVHKALIAGFINYLVQEGYSADLVRRALLATKTSVRPVENPKKAKREGTISYSKARRLHSWLSKQKGLVVRPLDTAKQDRLPFIGKLWTMMQAPAFQDDLPSWFGESFFRAQTNRDREIAKAIDLEMISSSAASLKALMLRIDAIVLNAARLAQNLREHTSHSIVLYLWSTSGSNRAKLNSFMSFLRRNARGVEKVDEANGKELLDAYKQLRKKAPKKGAAAARKATKKRRARKAKRDFTKLPNDVKEFYKGSKASNDGVVASKEELVGMYRAWRTFIKDKPQWDANGSDDFTKWAKLLHEKRGQIEGELKSTPDGALDQATLELLTKKLKTGQKLTLSGEEEQKLRAEAKAALGKDAEKQDNPDFRLMPPGERKMLLELQSKYPQLFDGDSENTSHRLTMRAKRGMVLRMAVDQIPGEAGAALRAMATSVEFWSGLSVSIGVYVGLWVAPEPLSKLIAGGLTAYLVAKLGDDVIDTMWNFADAWGDLERTASAATTVNELEVAAKKFSTTIGKEGARLLMEIGFWFLSRAAMKKAKAKSKDKDAETPNKPDDGAEAPGGKAPKADKPGSKKAGKDAAATATLASAAAEAAWAEAVSFSQKEVRRRKKLEAKTKKAAKRALKGKGARLAQFRVVATGSSWSIKLKVRKGGATSRGATKIGWAASAAKPRGGLWLTTAGSQESKHQNIVQSALKAEAEAEVAKLIKKGKAGESLFKALKRRLKRVGAAPSVIEKQAAKRGSLLKGITIDVQEETGEFLKGKAGTADDKFKFTVIIAPNTSRATVTVSGSVPNPWSCTASGRTVKGDFAKFPWGGTVGDTTIPQRWRGAPPYPSNPVRQHPANDFYTYNVDAVTPKQTGSYTIEYGVGTDGDPDNARRWRKKLKKDVADLMKDLAADGETGDLKGKAQQELAIKHGMSFEELNLKGWECHHIHEVNWGGPAVLPSNLKYLVKSEHQKLSRWATMHRNRMRRALSLPYR